MSRWPITGASTPGRGVAGQPVPIFFSILLKDHQSLDPRIGSSARTTDKYRRADMTSDIEPSGHLAIW